MLLSVLIRSDQCIHSLSINQVSTEASHCALVLEIQIWTRHSPWPHLVEKTDTSAIMTPNSSNSKKFWVEWRGFFWRKLENKYFLPWTLFMLFSLLRLFFPFFSSSFPPTFILLIQIQLIIQKQKKYHSLSESFICHSSSYFRVHLYKQAG